MCDDHVGVSIKGLQDLSGRRTLYNLDCWSQAPLFGIEFTSLNVTVSFFVGMSARAIRRHYVDGAHRCLSPGFGRVIVCLRSCRYICTDTDFLCSTFTFCGVRMCVDALVSGDNGQQLSVHLSEILRKFESAPYS
jgi:hypothetical protein